MRLYRFITGPDDSDRPLTDGERFNMAASRIVGKRLTYAQVTGKDGETTPSA